MRILSWVATVALFASGAHAETLRVETYFPAYSDELVMLKAIQVDTLGGRSGPRLMIELEDNLRSVDLGQGPWFRVIPPSISNGKGDAVLRGTADMEVSIDEYSEQRERCIRDANNKCTKEREKYLVWCERRNFTLHLALRLINNDGDLLWSENSRKPESDSSCEDSSNQPRSTSVVERMLVGREASRLADTFAPRKSSALIRIDESRKGLSKSDSDRFKAAVKLVRDKDVRAACEVWREIGSANSAHLPTQFNIGLCAESFDDDITASDHYRRAESLDAARKGLDRLIARFHARQQIAEHYK